MKKFLIAVLIIVAGIFIYLIYSGLFSSVKISEKEMGPYTIVCERFVGDYSKTGKVFDRVYDTLLKDFKVKTFKGAGIYYDDPKKVDKKMLRSDVGCILEEKDFSKIPEIQKKFKIIKRPAKMSVVAEFPLRSSVSIILGVIKVYPKLSEYLKGKKNLEPFIMEVYDMPNKKIEYIAPFK